MIRKNAMTCSSLTSETLIASPMEDLRATLRRAFPVVAIFVAMVIYAWPFVHTITDVIVGQKFNDYKYEMAYEHGLEAGRFWTLNICPDYRGPSVEEGFAPGMVLDRMTFVDMGTCWSLNPDSSQASFFNRKDANGNYTTTRSTATRNPTTRGKTN